MQVVEDEHERPVRGEPFQQERDRSVDAIALVRACLGRARRCARKARHDLSERAEHVAAERREQVRVETADVLVERVEKEREGHVALELGRGARQRQMPAFVCAGGELRE